MRRAATRGWGRTVCRTPASSRMGFGRLSRAAVERAVAVLLIAPGVVAGEVRRGLVLGGGEPRAVVRGGGRGVGRRHCVPRWTTCRGEFGCLTSDGSRHARRASDRSRHARRASDRSRHARRANRRTRHARRAGRRRWLVGRCRPGCRHGQRRRRGPDGRAAWRYGSAVGRSDRRVGDWRVSDRRVSDRRLPNRRVIDRRVIDRRVIDRRGRVFLARPPNIHRHSQIGSDVCRIVGHRCGSSVLALFRWIPGGRRVHMALPWTGQGLAVRRDRMLTRDFVAGVRWRNGALGRTAGRDLRDDLSRRVGALVEGATIAPSWVEVVCHHAADYQSEAIGDALRDPPATMDPQPGRGPRVRCRTGVTRVDRAEHQRIWPRQRPCTDDAKRGTLPGRTASRSRDAITTPTGKANPTSQRTLIARPKYQPQRDGWTVRTASMFVSIGRTKARFLAALERGRSGPGTFTTHMAELGDRSPPQIPPTIRTSSGTHTGRMPPRAPPTRRTTFARTAPHRTAPHRTAPHRTAPHRTAPHRTAPHRTAPHRTAPHRTAPKESRPAAPSRRITLRRTQPKNQAMCDDHQHRRGQRPVSGRLHDVAGFDRPYSLKACGAKPT
ncbi:hypothetical protein BJ971_001036 [Actinoplanes digitatis]|uniref:Uncharacterized protein n=1 Tax=Actinoplanes digitatis TaxID=1868 RepID=A0A7W7HTJ2_9ACTN|nr:hypothetical protein [Actinoplanes digitatis]